MAERQSTGSSSLLTIVNELNTIKSRMKTALNTSSDDFEEYATLAYNMLASYYNAGFANGYRTVWSEELVTYPPESYYSPYYISYHTFNPVSPTSTGNTTYNNLYDTITDSLRCRQLLKTALGTTSNEFVTYPDLISSTVLSRRENTGYDDGADQAMLDIENGTHTPTQPTSDDDYFTIDVGIASGMAKVVFQKTNSTYSPDITLQVRRYDDRTSTWSSWDKYSSNGNRTIEILINRNNISGNNIYGRKLQFRGNNSTFGKTSYPNVDNVYSWKIKCYTNYSPDDLSNEDELTFTVSGNLASLIKEDNFSSNVTFPDYAFCELFAYSRLEDAQNLVIPDGTQGERAFDSLFYGCTELVKGPKLKSTTLGKGSYSCMFYNCSSLTTAPELPATTLAERCYYGMFKNCTSLTTAPELPATTLVDRCYYYMFNGCSSLNYVKCLATDLAAQACTNNWLGSVAATGDFYKSSSINWGTGVSDVPSGWTVHNA